MIKKDLHLYTYKFTVVQPRSQEFRLGKETDNVWAKILDNPKDEEEVTKATSRVFVFHELLFPQPAIAAVDPRRQLSLQQQTQILTDVQQHHQQHQAESSLYTTQIEFGGESQATTTSTQKPFVYTQQTQFASRLHKSENLPSPQTYVRHSTRPGQRSSRFELNRSRSQPVTEATTTESTKQSPQEKLRSLRRRPAQDATTTTPDPYQTDSRPRARLLDQNKETDLPDQVYLQNERQKLLQQLKEYNQQQKLLSAQREKLLAEQAQKSEGLQESRAVPQIQSLSNDNPLKVQDSKSPTLNPLRKQQQQQQLQAQLQKQFQQQFIQRQELIRKLKQALSNAPPSASSGNNSSPVFLPNGQQLQVLPSPRDDPSLSFLTQDNSQPAQSIAARSTVVLPQTTTERPPEVLFQELTKGVLPPGAQFEVIRHKQDGGLESVGNLPANLPNKKVTFVFLEEQPDGTVKVQGVRGNNEGQGTPQEANPAVDVDSIIEKIQKGDLKLPPSAQLAGSPSVPTGIPVLETTPQESVLSPTFISRSSLEAFATTQRPNSLLTISSTVKPSQSRYSNFEHSFNSPDTEFIPSVTIPTQTDSTNTESPFILSDTQFGQKKFTPSPPDQSPAIYHNPYGADGKNSETLFVPASSSQSALSSRNHFIVPNQSTTSHKTSQKLSSSIHFEEPSIASLPVLQHATQETHTHFSPTPSSVSTVPSTPSVTPTPPSKSTTSSTRTKPQRGKFVPTVPTPQEDASGSEAVRPVYKRPESDEGTHGSPTVRSVPKSSEVRQNVVFPSAPEYRFSANSTKSTRGKSSSTSSSSNSKLTLSQVLKKEGLFAMAKFLRESGLDSILNDTGPYTVFAPTDKAFRALLIQLGGPDKAEEKFRENPRLLSGLLLHHVIPGAFKLDTLQDEMTGISLAGTQLRVNTYNTQDVEWNDVKVTTINGARIQRDQHDIAIPQGVAHAVDRVMFPLPVGDVMQTLQADRERRFAKFLRSVEASGLAETLSGTRTFTVFAPTDRAFTAMGTAEQLKVQAEREAARNFVQRHIVPGSLFSAGMRYYQVRPSLDPDHAITIVKNAGQLKANNAHVIAHNIPATNGVIHVTDTIIL
ncbi:putative mediator of RNA polymerase II transcription subunit 26 [Anabrus simplex]|uniref:putative mediator of RNA polymerase II transcription subunit 26 n=1 Tax=Anabrus simplex TaxID=316456 RepID=UPI0035A3378F